MRISHLLLSFLTHQHHVQCINAGCVLNTLLHEGINSIVHDVNMGACSSLVEICWMTLVTDY